MQIIFALVFVLALIGVVAMIIQKMKKVTLWRKSENGKLHIREILNLDIKKKLLIVDYNDKSYVLLLGNNDIVVDIIENIAKDAAKDEVTEMKQIAPTLY